MARRSSPENYYSSGRNTYIDGDGFSTVNDHNASVSPVPLSLVVDVAFAVLSDVPSAPRFLVDVFSFVVHAEFEVGVLAPEEFR